MSTPTVSVIMPVHNAEKYLRYSIESILSQTYKDFEFIIIDDASEDKSLEIIKNFKALDERVKLRVNRKNLGTTKSLNIGLNLARGKYIVRMDADDVSSPDRIEKQVEFMDKHQEIGMSGSNVEVCDSWLDKLYSSRYPITDTDIRKIILSKSPFAHPSVIIRTKILKKIGGYNELFPFSQDYELYFRIGRLAKFGNLGLTLLKLRRHKNSSSYLQAKLQARYAIYAREKACREYGYTMTLSDKLYNLIQKLSLIFIPSKIRFSLHDFIFKLN